MTLRNGLGASLFRFPPLNARALAMGGLGWVCCPVAWLGQATGDFGYPVVSIRLGRHYMLLGVNTGWPWLEFPVGWVFGVSFAGVFCLGCHWFPLWLDF